MPLPEQLIFFDDDSMGVNRFDLIVTSDPDQMFHLKNDTFPLSDKNATLVNVSKWLPVQRRPPSMTRTNLVFQDWCPTSACSWIVSTT